MKRPNMALRADVARIVELKLQIPDYKNLAEKHHVKRNTIAKLVSAMLAERRKSNFVAFHVEQTDEKIAP